MDFYSVRDSGDWGDEAATKKLHAQLFCQKQKSNAAVRRKPKKKVIEKQIARKEGAAQQNGQSGITSENADNTGVKKKRNQAASEGREPVKKRKMTDVHERVTKQLTGQNAQVETVEEGGKKKRKRRPRNNKFKNSEFGYVEDEVVISDGKVEPSPTMQNGFTENSKNKKRARKKAALRKSKKVNEDSIIRTTKSGVTNLDGSKTHKPASSRRQTKNTSVKLEAFKRKAPGNETKTQNAADQESDELVANLEAKRIFRSKMESQLRSAHFRYLNEQLYKTTGSQAKKMMTADMDAFRIYHEGFSQQVKHWPLNPVNIFIEYLQSRPASLAVGDFGCGEALIAQSAKQTVHSFDLCALNKHVTVCDMEKIKLKNDSLDVAIFCLSLMGTNWIKYLQEANRVLKDNGRLKIAEVASRFASVPEFLKILQQLGFKKDSTDFSNKMFLMFDFIKKGSCKKVPLDRGEVLRACLYKKR